MVVPYTFEDVVAGLNGVVAMDWASFLKERLTVLTADAPLGGLANGGWKLVYKDVPTNWEAMEYGNAGTVDFWYSLGFSVGGSGR